MRHGKKINHLGRTCTHRKSMLSNMANSLIHNKRIYTTLSKAKSLARYIEPIISKSKIDTTHSRRLVFKLLKNKISIYMLFGDISKKIGERPGGYTRIIKIGTRLGDGANTAMIEFVDFNDIYNINDKNYKKRSRYSSNKK